MSEMRRIRVTLSEEIFNYVQGKAKRPLRKSRNGKIETSIMLPDVYVAALEEVAARRSAHTGRRVTLSELMEEAMRMKRDSEREKEGGKLECE